MSDIAKELEGMLREMFFRELDEAIKEDLTPPPGWGGFTGLLGLFDEMPPLPPIAWTPWEFKRMWDSLERESKVNYIKSLMSDL